MYYSKDIENFGTGLKRIALACEEAGVKLEFRLLKNGFAVVFYRPGEQFITTDKMSNGTINGTINGTLSIDEQAMLSILIENPTFTVEQIAERLSKSKRTTQRYLNSLREKNVIKRVGARKDGYFDKTMTPQPVSASPYCHPRYRRRRGGGLRQTEYPQIVWCSRSPV